MKYIDNWDIIKLRYKETWNLENHDRPLMNVTSFSPRTPAVALPKNIEDRWLDVDYVVKNARYIVENQHYSGESFPTVFTNLGPDIFAALYGAVLKFKEITSWSEHIVQDWGNYIDNLVLQRNSMWYKKLIELTTAMVEESRGDYIVGITDIHTGMDALVAMRGPSELCMDIYDCPELIEKLPIKLFEGFKEVYGKLFEITNKYEKGSTTWMKVYSEDRFYVTSCDLICMISQSDFNRFVRQELVEEARWLDKNIFHLDGEGALRHLDSILEIKEITGVQWVPGDGALSIDKWGDILTKIQRAGKVLQIHVNTADELKNLSEIIRPEGVMIDAYTSCPQDADDMVALSKNLWKK